MSARELRSAIFVLIAIVVGSCGAGPAAAPGASASPAASASPKATLASIAAQPGDLPSAGLKVCADSGDLSAPSASLDGPAVWKAVQQAGAVEGWIQVLKAACPGDRTTPRIVNHLIRFRDAAAAEAFFASEKANARTTSVLWPGGTEGSATGLGSSSVAIAFNATDYCAFWTNRALAISYCDVKVGADDTRKGALAVNARAS